MFPKKNDSLLNYVCKRFIFLESDLVMVMMYLYWQK